MDIAAYSASISAATNPARIDVRDAAGLLVLKKAIDTQAAGALALINTLPQQTSLATQGNLGRNLDTYA